MRVSALIGACLVGTTMWMSGLRLAGVIDWPWALVMSPILLPAVAIGAFAATVLVLGLLAPEERWR